MSNINVALVEEILRLEKQIATLEYELERSQQINRNRDAEIVTLKAEVLRLKQQVGDLKEDRDAFLTQAALNADEARRLQDRLDNHDDYDPTPYEYDDDEEDQ